MCEILFRGKRLDNGEWVQGSYLKSKDYLTGETVHIITEDATIFPYAEISGCVKVEAATVGQFIGLKDRYATEIFEGDILEVTTTNVDEEDGYGIVLYDEGTAGFIVEFAGFVVDFDNLYDYECEVIGNIHDNPELRGGA